MHVLTPGVMEVLGEQINSTKGSVALSDALNKSAQREQYLALRVRASRYNIGVKYGFLKGQLALALSGKDRDDILTELLELVATTRGEA
jgi:UTP--glucose-1-phosphate uridylyltransferase